MVIQHPKKGDHCKDGHPKSEIWSPTKGYWKETEKFFCNLVTKIFWMALLCKNHFVNILSMAFVYENIFHALVTKIFSMAPIYENFFQNILSMAFVYKNIFRGRVFDGTCLRKHFRKYSLDGKPLQKQFPWPCCENVFDGTP